VEVASGAAESWRSADGATGWGGHTHRMYTLHGLILDFFEGLEAPGEQGFEVKPVFRVGGREAVFNRGTKGVKGGVVAGIQIFFTHKAPEPLDQVEMGGIGWEIA